MGEDETTGGEVERGYVPWADLLEGVSAADAERIRVLRIWLLTALVRMTLVVEECARCLSWQRRTRPLVGARSARSTSKLSGSTWWPRPSSRKSSGSTGRG